ncbi:MAG TPA: sigma-70 family RNA polymerase sigma factor [Gemmatimonadales bacterium]|nr:sigma-70 family RNA polymerase sigma factor [Gemmatimonadales bacterium]
MIPAGELEKEIEALVAEHYKDLERYLRCGKIRLPEFLVGEVINDALLVIVDKRRRGHAFADVRAYLFRVARNAAIDSLKFLYAIEIPDSEAITAHPDGHDMLASAEISYDIRQAVRQLPRRQRQVVELRFRGDFTVKETAEILDMAEGTVGPTTSAALRRLKQIMTAPGGTREDESA